MQTIHTFPSLKKAALIIAYDNGRINRLHPVAEFFEDCNKVIGADGVDYADLVKIDDFLGSLDEEDLETLCAGEDEDQAKIYDRWVAMPWFGDKDMLDGLLNDIFEGSP